jgi:hypothetical protein
VKQEQRGNGHFNVLLTLCGTRAVVIVVAAVNESTSKRRLMFSVVGCFVDDAVVAMWS